VGLALALGLVACGGSGGGEQRQISSSAQPSTTVRAASAAQEIRNDVPTTCFRLKALSSSSDPAELRKIAGDAVESMRPQITALAAAAETADVAGALGPIQALSSQCTAAGVLLPGVTVTTQAPATTRAPAATVPTAPPTTAARPPATAAPAAYYTNCAEARRAGAAPVRRGQPGYATHLDRDGDGVGCET